MHSSTFPVTVALKIGCMGAVVEPGGLCKDSCFRPGKTMKPWTNVAILKRDKSEVV